MNGEDLFGIIRQIIFGLIAVMGGVAGMVWALEQGYNEWLSFLLPLSASTVTAFLVDRLAEKVLERLAR